MTDFERQLFVLSVKVLSQYKSKWVDASSFVDSKFWLTILKFLQEGLPFILKIRAAENVVPS